MPVPPPTPVVPPLTREIVDSCSFSSWYPRFQACSIKATILPLPREFVAYLREDGLFLPRECDDPTANGSDDSDAAASDDSHLCRWRFPELTDAIRRAITNYGGAVFPKLNWSSPQDAAFLLPCGDGPLRCRLPADVYMLLKGSDFIAHDLERAYEGCEHGEDPSTAMDALAISDDHRYELVLKKWYALHPAGEFRCYVRDRRILGICTRTTFYDFLLRSEVQICILNRIGAFFSSTVCPGFPCVDYTFDIHLPAANALPPQRLPRPTLIDFNPYGPPTSPLLFTYNELLDIYLRPSAGEGGEATPELRVWESDFEAGKATGAGAKFAASRMPAEAVELSQGVNIDEFARKWREAIEEASRE